MEKWETILEVWHIFEGIRIAIGSRAGFFGAISDAQRVTVNSFLAITPPKAAAHAQKQEKMSRAAKKRNAAIN